LADDRVALIKQANDIVDVVGGYVNLRPAGAKFKGLCPFHDDSRPSFDVDPRFQNYRCWSCNKHGDVITFIMERERVDFREALELLARRAGITLEKTPDSPQSRSRALMLDCVKWAAEQYHRCLLDSTLAEVARVYLGERHLTEETVRRFGLGFAPAGRAESPTACDWLLQRARAAGIDLELLEKVGLLRARQEGRGYFDWFRDRVMFPIRNNSGHTIAFGGRILPSSPFAARAPKYYNSCETPLFTKSEHLYGLDQARQAAAAAGYLAVVEGYTDVLMAHQMGVTPVVATLGTALNARHVQHLRRMVPRVVLVFDADAGGKTGVDRALELFVSQNVDLAIATLPEGLDPCDLLVQQGPEPFQAALAAAVDVLEFKLDQLLASESAMGVEGRRRALEAVLAIIALAPGIAGTDGTIRQLESIAQMLGTNLHMMAGSPSAIRLKLIMTRLAQRLALREEDIWARLRELRARKRKVSMPSNGAESTPALRRAPAPPLEKQLLQVLLADPTLVPATAVEVRPEHLQHPGLRELLQGLYALHAAGEPPTLDLLRARIDNPALADAALDLQAVGRLIPDRPTCLRQLLTAFRRQREVEPQQQELKNQLHAASDHATALDLLRRLQTQTNDVAPGKPPASGSQDAG
jgi:DNA primase